MNTSNVKLGAAVAVVIALVLVFSWQYTGQDDSQSPMVGEWNIACVIDMDMTGASPTIASDADSNPVPDMTITQDGDIIIISSYAGEQRFALVSDCEAISIKNPTTCSLYHNGDALFHIDHLVTEGGTFKLVMTMMTSDGTVDTEQDVSGIIGRSVYSECKLFDANGETGESDITVNVEKESFRTLGMTVTIDDSDHKAIGFLKDSDGRQVIEGVIDNGTVFSLIIDKGDIILTGVTSDNKFIVGDTDGCLSEDILGISDRHVVNMDIGRFPSEVDMDYRNGLMYVSSSDLNGNAAVYMPGLHGDGYFLTSVGAPIILIDGTLTMLSNGILF